MNEFEGVESGYWTEEDKEQFLSEWWEEEDALSPEEAEASRRAQARVWEEEALGELYASQYAFD